MNRGVYFMPYFSTALCCSFASAVIIQFKLILFYEIVLLWDRIYICILEGCLIFINI